MRILNIFEQRGLDSLREFLYCQVNCIKDCEMFAIFIEITYNGQKFYKLGEPIRFEDNEVDCKAFIGNPDHEDLLKDPLMPSTATAEFVYEEWSPAKFANYQLDVMDRLRFLLRIRREQRY